MTDGSGSTAPLSTDARHWVRAVKVVLLSFPEFLHMLKKALLASLLLTASVGVFAQAPAAPAQSAAPALTAQQQAQMAQQNEQMAKNSLQIAGMIDNGQAGAVWDQASFVARQSSSRADFIAQITADRAEVGNAS
jgi:hypothetical protein